jgi:DivIVA domain-containing protein
LFVALERQSIQKKDFPIGRRGYDPEAVDTHLASLADEVDELKRSSRKRTETLASSASEQVRTIVEAAENSAASIQRQAEDEAREIRSEAATEAQREREQATDQARDYVGQVSEATAVMLQRIDAMEGELTALVESLRTGSNRLNADLQLLQGNLTELRGSASTKPSYDEDAAEEEEDTVLEPAVELEVVEEEEPVAEPALEDEYLETSSEAGDDSAAIAALAPDQEPASGEASDDAEGARLIALNMALNGTPREETDRYLAANFRLEDRDALLDEVYASVEG